MDSGSRSGAIRPPSPDDGAFGHERGQGAMLYHVAPRGRRSSGPVYRKPGMRSPSVSPASEPLGAQHPRIGHVDHADMPLDHR